MSVLKRVVLVTRRVSCFSSLQKFSAPIGKQSLITVKGDAEDETQFSIYWGDKTVQP